MLNVWLIYVFLLGLGSELHDGGGLELELALRVKRIFIENLGRTLLMS